MKIKKLNEDIQHCWFGYYIDKDGNQKYFYMTKDSTSKDPDEASDIMEDSIPEPFTKFVFQGSVANTQAERQGMKLIESKFTNNTLNNSVTLKAELFYDNVDNCSPEELDTFKKLGWIAGRAIVIPEGTKLTYHNSSNPSGAGYDYYYIDDTEDLIGFSNQDPELDDIFGEVDKEIIEESLSEGLEIETIADYITDHYKFETIDDKYSCINSIRDSFKDEKTISKEELEQFIGSHNGKDKMTESLHVDEIADYLEDYFIFDSVDDKYNCVDDIVRNYDKLREVSEEEFKPFVLKHNGKDKVNESKFITGSKRNMSEDELIAYIRKHPELDEDDLDDLNCSGMFDIPDSFCDDPYNVTEDEAFEYFDYILKKANESKSIKESIDLNGNALRAAEHAIDQVIYRGYSIKDAVEEGCGTYGFAGLNPEYIGQDIYDEEAKFDVVLQYVTDWLKSRGKLKESKSIKESTDLSITKELDTVYNNILDTLYEGSNADLVDNIKKVFTLVGGNVNVRAESDDYIKYQGYISHGEQKDYRISGSVLRSTLKGDLNRLAEDLTMAYYRTKLGGKLYNTPELMKKIKNYEDVLIESKSTRTFNAKGGSLNEEVELWDKSRVTDLVNYYLDRSNKTIDELARLIMKQMKDEGSKLPYNITDFYDALYIAVDNYNEQFEESLNEDLSPREGDRVQMDFYAKDNNGATGTCTGRIGELCFIEWDDGTKSKEIKGYLKVIERPSMNEASYGGAFDIADDQYFTREDLDDFSEEVLNHINETFVTQFDVNACFIDDGVLELEVTNDEYGDYTISEKIDMRKIKEPWHLKRAYASWFASELINDIKRSNDGLIEDLNESLTTDAKPIETGAAVGMAAVLSDLIKDEYEAIEGYNSAIATAEAEGYGDMVKVLTDIQAEENIHIGQLQELMKMVDPNAHKIEDGYAEAAEELSNPIDDNIVNDDDTLVLVTEDIDCDDDIADEDVDELIKKVEEAMNTSVVEEDVPTLIDEFEEDEIIVESTEPWEDIYKSFKDIEVQLNGDGEAITATIDRIYQDNKDNPDFEKAYQKWASNE